LNKENGWRVYGKNEAGLNIRMQIYEIQPIKPKAPEQQRVDSLQAISKRAHTAVKAEKARQKMAKSQQSIAALWPSFLTKATGGG
jgi:hypothetical protein